MPNDPALKLTDKETEQAVIGSILIDPDAMMHVADVLAVEDFYDERARWVYEAAQTLYHQQQDIDTLTLCNELERTGHLAQIGGAVYLTDTIRATPTAMHVDSYARRIGHLATLRKLLQVAGNIAQMAYNADESAGGLIEKIHSLVDSVTPMASTDDVLLWLDSLERFVVGQVQRNSEQADIDAGAARPALELPWRAFDRFKVKFRAGTFGLVVAGSGVGKTTFMECCAEYWARLGYRVAFFHLELSHQIMLDRRMARLSGVSIDDIERGHLNERTQKATEQMRAYRGGITYVHCPQWTARAICTKMRQLYNRGLCDVAIVDYLQKIRLFQPRGRTTNDALADAAEVVKSGCEQLGIAGLMGSQVNRRAEDAGRVTGDHLRGSGEVPEKGNVTITLRRDILQDPLIVAGVPYQAGARSPLMDVRIDKNTMGPTGDTQLMMHAPRFLIDDVSHQKEAA